MILGIVLLIFLAIFLSILNYDRKYTPGMFLCMAWIIVYILQVVFAADMYESINAGLIIFLLTASFGFGDFVGAGLASRLAGNTRECLSLYDARFRHRLAIIIQIMGVLSLLGAFEYANALGLFGYGALDEAILRTGAIRVALMEGHIQVPYISRLGFLLAFSCWILGLCYFFFFGWRWWIFLPFLAIVIMGVSQSGRAGMMIAVLQLIVAIFLRETIIIGRSPANTARKFIVPVLLLAFVFFGGQFLRESFSGLSSDDAVRVALSLRGYFFGGLSAFSYYVDHLMDDATVAYGVFTFSGLVAAFGIHPQATGVYNEYVPIDRLGSVTNIFSAHRSLIDDFSLFGAVLILFFFGSGIGFLHRLFLSGVLHFCAFIIPLLSWVCFSPMYSLTYFNSFLMSCLLPYLILRGILGLRNVSFFKFN